MKAYPQGSKNAIEPNYAFHHGSIKDIVIRIQESIKNKGFAMATSIGGQGDSIAMPFLSDHSSSSVGMGSNALSRILFVEDDPDIQVVTQTVLEKMGGFVLEICNSGRDALKSAPNFQPDLVLLDVMMPDMDGPDTLLALRELPGFADIPVIFFTAKTQRQELEKFRKMGVLGVISKPFDPMQLPAEIEKLWASGLSGNQQAAD